MAGKQNIWGIIGYDIDAFLSALGDRLWHIHLRDSKGPDTVDFKQDLELTPGDGTVDFRAFAKALDTVKYNGDVSLELLIFYPRCKDNESD